MTSPRQRRFVGPRPHPRASGGQPRLLHITTVPATLRFLLGQAPYLRRHGFEVLVLSSPGSLLEQFGASEGTPTFAVPMRRAISPLGDLLSLGKILHFVRRSDPDIIDVHTPKAALLGMVAAWLARTPVRVLHLHGLRYATASGAKRRVLWLTERVSTALATQILAVGDELMATAIRDGLCSPRKIKVLGRGSINGVDAAGRFSPDAVGRNARQRVREEHGIPEGGTVIGFVGRIVPDKGIAELAAAWQRVRQRHPRSHLLLVGDFEEHAPVAPSVRLALNADPRVTITGFLWDTPPLFAAMDLVVLPTYREGFPVVPLEAAAMGLAVLATTATGCGDAVLDGVTGTLVPPRDAPALARALDRYLANPALRQAHGQAGRARVLRDFSPAGLHEALRAEYHAMLTRATAPSGLPRRLSTRTPHSAA